MASYVMNTTERIPSNYKNRDVVNTHQMEIIESSQNQNSENNSQPQNIIAPFGSLADKSSIVPKYLNNIPGPGAYDISPENHFRKNSNSVSQSTDNILKNFFITREERFKEKQNNIPGVGDYDLFSNTKKNSTPKKNVNLYKRIGGAYPVNSPDRVSSIPSKNNAICFCDEDDPEKIIERFNGTKNNSIGPDRYNLDSPKRNNAIDWKRSPKKLLELEKNNNTFLNNINVSKSCNIQNNNNNYKLYKDGLLSKNSNVNINNDNYSVSSSVSNKFINSNNDIKKIKKNNIYRNDFMGLRENYHKDDIDLTSVPIKKKYEIITPGPGAYNYKEAFKIEPKKNKYQNFGSFVSRDLQPIEKINTYKNLLSENDNIYKNHLNLNINEKNKVNEFIHSLHNLKVETICEKNMNRKKKVEENLGPGSYNPLLNSPKKNNNQNIGFGSIESRFKTEENENHKIVYYNESNNWIRDTKNGLLQQVSSVQKEQLQREREVQEEIEKLRREMKTKAKPREEPIIEYKDSEEYKIRKAALENYNRPGFGGGEQKFKVLRNDINENNGVGSYNLLYPEREKMQKKVPFSVSSKKFSEEKIKSNRNVGPGSYEQNSFFDWNKKSFNVNYKYK